MKPTLRWKDDLDDDGKPWRSLLVLQNPGKPWPCDEDWLAKIMRLNAVPSLGQPPSFHYNVPGILGGKTRTMGSARAACLRLLRRRAVRVIEALGGRVIPPKKERRC